MKIKSVFSLKQDGKHYSVIADGQPPREVLSLDELSAFLFEKISGGTDSKEQLLNDVLERFDISAVLALSEIDGLLKELRENGITES